MVALSLGALTLLLTIVGMFGVLAHVVARRTREFGVRIALGATRAHVARIAVMQGLKPVIQGLVIGATFDLALRLLITTVGRQSILVWDPVAFSIVTVPILTATLVACYLPSRRAAGVDPSVALRAL